MHLKLGGVFCNGGVRAVGGSTSRHLLTLTIKRNCRRGYQRNIYEMDKVLLDKDVIPDFFSCIWK